VKLALLPFAVVAYTCLHGQEKNTTYSSFAIDNKEVVWVQVYEGPQEIDVLTQQVFQFLKRKSWITNVHFDGSEVVADIKNFRVDYKRYGGKYMNTSNLIRTGRWSGKTRITFKEGKYRVIVYGLEYDARQPGMHAGKMSNQPHMVHGSWTDWVLNNYRSHFKRSRHINMDIMHFNLKDGFTMTDTELIDSEW
jgi:hypothetical protein